WQQSCVFVIRGKSIHVRQHLSPKKSDRKTISILLKAYKPERNGTNCEHWFQSWPLVQAGLVSAAWIREMQPLPAGACLPTRRQAIAWKTTRAFKEIRFEETGGISKACRRYFAADDRGVCA